MKSVPPLYLPANIPGLWWWILGGATYLIAATALREWVRWRRNRHGSLEKYTGRTLQRILDQSPSDAAAPRTTTQVVVAEGAQGPLIWRGRGRGRIGRQRAPIELVIRQGELAMWVRPWILGTVIGSGFIGAHTGETCVAFPARHRWGSREYVGIRTSDRIGYFQTDAPAHLLSRIEQAGFEVDWREQKVAS